MKVRILSSKKYEMNKIGSMQLYTKHARFTQFNRFFFVHHGVHMNIKLSM